MKLVKCSVYDASHAHVTRHTSQITRHTSHVVPSHLQDPTFDSIRLSVGIDYHVTRHTQHVTRCTSHVSRHTSYVARHTSHVTRHTSHITHHTSHVTRNRGTRPMSHVTCHTSHITRHMSRPYTDHCGLMEYSKGATECLKVRGLGFRFDVCCLWFRVLGLGFGANCFGVWVLNSSASVFSFEFHSK